MLDGVSAGGPPVDGGAALAGTNVVQRAVTAAVVQDHELRQLPTESGTVATNLSGVRDETGFGNATRGFAGPGRDDMFTSEAPMFPQFFPSPLPGQSPTTTRTASSTRAATWLSKIGDYLQRTVEVTSWSAHGTPAQASSAQRPVQGGPVAVSRPQLPVASRSSFPSVENRPPSSSGSAGVSPELVQAEVAKQVEAAMGDLHGQLRRERERTEEAMKEAQLLRRQLETHEMRVALGQKPPPGLPLSHPPGLQGHDDLSIGVSGVTPNHPPLVPTAVETQSLPLVASGQLVPHHRHGGEYGSVDLGREPSGTVPASEVPGVYHGLGRDDLSVGVSGVTANHPPSGPSIASAMPKPRARSQSPGPRAFLQGLFGRGGQDKSDQAGDQHVPRAPMSTAVYTPISGAPHASTTAPTTTPEGNLLATMARGIEALLNQQQTARGDRPETVKPGIGELPALPEYEPATGSIDLLHWITHIGPIMEDLSDTSYAWWQATMKAALSWYSQYSTAPPLERLQLRPQPSLELSKPEWSRVERRATAMLLTAVPKSVREEIIAYGQVSSLNLSCKLYATYQPGNLQEKGLVLRMLEQPEPCSTALEAVEGLRKWSLWRKRATTIGMAEPDASVLVRGLDKITSPVVQGSGELSFRISLIRSTLQVDVSPSATTVTTFLQHLQAEMEQQARLGASQPPAVAGPGIRAITMVDPSSSCVPPPPPASSTTTRPTNGLCRFFQGDKGCRRGNTCRFPHTWSLLEKGARSRKCLACGSTAHKVKDCKSPGGGQSPTKGSRTTGATNVDGGASSPTASSQDAPPRKVNFEGDGAIQSKVLQVLHDVQGLPLFKSVMERIHRWTSSGSCPSPRTRLALLDSGATHVLRGPHSGDEWDQAKNVQVQLAGDSFTSMKQTEAGTLLNGDQLAQMIVPLGRVISTLGYSLNWSKDACQLEGPDGEVIPLEVVRGCPQVSERIAQRLIARLEDDQLQDLQETTEASAKALKVVRTSWWSWLAEYVATGNVHAGQLAVDKASFLDYKELVKDTVITKPPLSGIWELMKELNINRRARKRLLRAEEWILRWDPPTVDRARDEMKHLSYWGRSVYINMNTLLVDNEFSEVWRVIQWAAFNGMIGVVVVRDCPPKPLEQLAAGTHRSKVLLAHALASAGRHVKAGRVVRLYVEDLERADKARSESESLQGSVTWPAWTQCKDAKEYLSEMGLVDVSISRFTGERHVRLARLNSDAAWRLHVARNHQPFRRDCAVCVRNSATGQQHRATAHPMAYSLSVDVVGPIKGYGRSPDGKFFKYFVIGAFRIPQVEGARGHGEVRGHPLPPGDLVEEEEQLSDDDGDPGEESVEAGGVAPDDVEDEEKKWKELKATFKEPISTTTLCFAIPVNNKKAATMLPAVQRIVTDVKSLGYPVTRLHSDRGGEFRGNLVRKWALSQGMWPTTTSGSDSAANGVAESGVKFLKRRARVSLDSAGVAKENWPTAVQYAAAQQRCDQLGVLPPLPVAYGTKVYVKTKRYKTGAVEDFTPHWTCGKYVGLSTDIRGGHVILKDTGTFVQTTHVRVTKEPPTLDEVMPTVIVEPDDEGPPPEEPPLPPPLSSPPAHRIRIKGPSVAKLDGFYQEFEAIPDMSGEITLFEEEPPELRYLRVGEIQYVEGVAQRMCMEGKYTERDGARLLSLLAGTCGNLKVPRAPLGTGMVLGAYVHGGSFGIARYGRDLPWVTRFFNAYMMKKIRKTWPNMACSWTTLAIQSAAEIPRHRDAHNEPGTYNYALELKTESLECKTTALNVPLLAGSMGRTISTRMPRIRSMRAIS